MNDELVPSASQYTKNSIYFINILFKDLTEVDLNNIHKETANQVFTVESIQSLQAMIHSDSPSEIFRGVIGFRKLVSIENNPPLQEVIDSGVLPKIISFMSPTVEPLLQLESAWVITNIASGNANQTNAVISLGAIDAMESLLNSPKPEVIDQAIWGLGNFAGENAELRNQLISLKLVDKLCEILQKYGKNNLSILRNGSWALSNLCRGKPPPDYKAVAVALPLFLDLVKNCNDIEVRTDCLWALSYLTDPSEDCVIDFISRDGIKIVFPFLNSYLSHDNFTLQIPAVRIMGNLTSGQDEATQAVINCGVIPELFEILKTTQKKTLRKEILWTFSNIAAGTTFQKDELLYNTPLMNIISKIALRDTDIDVAKEAIWTLSNLCDHCTESQAKKLIDHQFLHVINERLLTVPHNIKPIIVEGFSHLLNNSFTNFYKIRIFQLIEDHNVEEILNDLGCKFPDENHQRLHNVIQSINEIKLFLLNAAGIFDTIYHPNEYQT